MASRSAVAAKLGAANSSVDESMSRIAHALELEVSPPSGKSKDLAHGAAMNAERMAVFLSHVADKVDPDGTSLEAVGETPQNEVTPEPMSVQEQLAQPAPDEDATDDPDPKIGGHKLSFYEGRDDSDILKLKGVGEATLKQIREAQAARE